MALNTMDFRRRVIMADRPILFSAPMVRALLDGRKTQTRRVLKKQSYAAGDRLWVREAWRPLSGYSNWDIRVLYPANDAVEHFLDGEGPDGDWAWPKSADMGFVPSIHMPRWASRITLIVTNVRVQRLQEISEDDARAEGIAERQIRPGDTRLAGQLIFSPNGEDGPFGYDHVDGFRQLWNGLNAKRGFGWDANPWVSAISFRCVVKNIDSLRGKE
jgi:hypothetical protein